MSGNRIAMNMNLNSLKKNVRPLSLVDSIYETLLEAIVSGQLPHGSELNSVGLAKQLEVSRTPLREALRLLERDGLVHQEGNHKARVAEFSADDIREIYEVRLQLEAAACRTGRETHLAGRCFTSYARNRCTESADEQGRLV